MAERGVQHGQRIDEAMEGELEGIVRGAPVETRAREDLGAETVETSVPRPDLEDGEEHRELLERSELARYLRPSAFPGDVDTLIAVAREEYAPDGLVGQLERLSRSTVYATVAEVWEGLGHETEHRDATAPDVESHHRDATIPDVADEALAPVTEPAVAPPRRVPRIRDEPNAEPRDEESPNVIEWVGQLGFGIVRAALRLPGELVSTARRLLGSR